jgi:hypothetical protein
MAPRLAGSGKWRAAEVRALIEPAAVAVPAVAALRPELDGYDRLLDRDAGEGVADVG